MKILILGGTGLMGHRFLSTFSQNHDTWALIRSKKYILSGLPFLDLDKVIENLDFTNLDKLEYYIGKISPSIIINCIGIIKQTQEAKDPILNIHFNSLFPQQLAQLCQKLQIRLIHFSTDCVFSGRKGNYNELDLADATDLYGRSKLLGEIFENPYVLTLRTSIIGREILPKGSLLEWFLSQVGKEVQGFSHAIYSGFPTFTLAKIINEFILPNPNLSGIYHISSPPITKYDLLCLIRDLYDLPVKIKRNSDFVINRSLDCTLLQTKINFRLDSWSNMIGDLKIDEFFYCKKGQ